MLLAGAALGALALLPAIARPAIGLAVVAAAVAAWLASKSVAYPLAFAFLPSLVDAIYGSNPLPKGGVTFLFAAWTGLAVVLAVVRGQRVAPTRALVSAPVVLSFVLLSLMIVRLGPSIAEAYGSTKIQLYVANNLVFLVGAIFVGSRASDTRLFLMLMLGIAAAGAVLLVFQLATGTAQQLVAQRFSISAQEYPIQLGRSSSDGLLLAIYGMLAARTVPGRLWAVAVFPALLVTLIAAGSRGPVLAFFFAVLALVTMSAASGRARRRLSIVAGAVLGAAILVPLVVPGSTIGRAVSTIVGSASGLSTNGRSELWTQAITAFGQHPLLGLGTGGFAGIQPTELYPHNVLLEAAVELGILGGIVVAAFIIGALRRFVGMWRAADATSKLDVALVISLFLAALVNALFSGAIQDNRELWLWTGLGLGMSARIRLPTGRSPGSTTLSRSSLGFDLAVPPHSI